MIFFWQSIFFLAAQFLGLAVALKVPQLIDVEQVQTPELVPWKILLVFAVMTAIFLLLLKLPRGKGFVFRALFALTIWWGGSLALSVWMLDIFALGVITGALILFFWKGKIFLHDTLVVLGIAGIASVFGLRFKPETIVIFLIVFAAYDVIAVYKTKHMVNLAKAMLSLKAIFAIIAPRKLTDFLSSMKEVAPGKDFMLLGGGDIAFPLMLSASVSRGSLTDSLIIIGFSFLGLVSVFALFFKLGKKPMPALPPIAIFSIIGFLLAKFL